MTDRDTVNKSERMKVTVCLNPIHTALGPYGCVLGYDLFSDEMKDPDMLKLGNLVGYGEGMEVVPDPVILSPKKFLDELMQERFPNPYLGDTCLRLCTDSSQGLGVRCAGPDGKRDAGKTCGYCDRRPFKPYGSA